MFRRLVWVSVLLGWSSSRLRPASSSRCRRTAADRGRRGAGGSGVIGASGRGGTAGRGGGAGTGSGRLGRRELGRIDRGQLGRVLAGAGTGPRRGHGRVYPGGVCTTANPCHVGQTVCSASGVASCMDTGTAQANGTVCGVNMVCNNGACAACAAGSACTPTTNAVPDRSQSSARPARPSAPKPRQAERDLVRDRDGLLGGTVRGLSERRRLHADEPLSSGDAHLLDGDARLHRQEHAGRRGNELRDGQGVQRDRRLR